MAKGVYDRSAARTRWKKPEEELVIGEMVALLRNDPSLSMMDAIKTAQKVLPETRWKKWFQPTIRARLKTEALSQIQSQLSRHLPAPTPKTIQIAAPAAKVEEPKAAPPPTEAEGIQAAFAVLGAALAKELAKALMPMIEQLVRPKINGNGAHHDPEQLQEAPAVRDFGDLDFKFHRPKVAIACLLPDQMAEIKNTFRHIDFRFVAPRTNASQAEELARGCDCSIAMLKFCGHPMSQALQRGADRAHRPMVKCPGGITSLKQIIRMRFGENEISMAKIMEANSKLHPQPAQH